jgi:hypothetical protein
MTLRAILLCSHYSTKSLQRVSEPLAYDLRSNAVHSGSVNNAEKQGINNKRKSRLLALQIATVAVNVKRGRVSLALDVCAIATLAERFICRNTS